MKNDLQIAKEIELKPITEIAEQLNISDQIDYSGYTIPWYNVWSINKRHL